MQYWTILYLIIKPIIFVFLGLLLKKVKDIKLIIKCYDIKLYFQGSANVSFTISCKHIEYSTNL